MTYVAGKAAHLDRTGSVDNLEHRTSAADGRTEVRRRLAVVGTDQEPGLRAGNRWVGVAVHPCAAPSCQAGRTDLEDLAVDQARRSGQLLVERAPHLACVHSPLLSSSPSILF